MKKKGIQVLTLLLVLVLLVSGGYLALQGLSRFQGERDYQEAVEIAGLKPDAASPPEGTTTQPGKPLDPVAAALADIDLAALRDVNGEVVAWIHIPGIGLSYPVTQHSDNQYYLNHTWTGTRAAMGAIFMECECSPALSDFHTIIYGHRMTTDTMFGMLKYYSDPAYREEHPSVYLAMPDGVYRYDIFAAFTAHVTSMVYRLDLPGKEAEFVEFCLENSEIDTGIVPSPEDRLLTMSTCVDMGQSDYRWVVQGRLAQVYSAKPTAEE